MNMTPHGKYGRFGAQFFHLTPQTQGLNRQLVEFLTVVLDRLYHKFF